MTGVNYDELDNRTIIKLNKMAESEVRAEATEKCKAFYDRNPVFSIFRYFF